MTIFPPDPDFDALRLELARLRAARGWTYDELAARSGLARRTLIEIEQGRTIGTLNELVRDSGCGVVPGRWHDPVVAIMVNRAVLAH
ncbi:helix-turn-helix transcriptional regulator, partial [Streptomyces sp. NPDC058319]|uniref:helix-turn-helix transcriptional regulator n=1 Tax=unclassified Streptomyces TaxID=2593676 RepID=UPI0036EF0285